MKHSLLAVVALAMLAAPAMAAVAPESDSRLGDINFPNSGAPEAQDAFLRGVAALHNFWFEEAEEAFKNAQELDSDFALAYWGEAMSYNHPLWAEQDIAAARAVMQKLGRSKQERLSKAGTDRERMYLEAIEELYGEGDKLARDYAYEKAMGRLRAEYPEDTEAAIFHALAILGTVRPGEPGFARQMRAGAIALDVFHEYPNHPGAAHFVIHSFDDPEHAPLALEAAERYAEIAPEAHHALHMPSHIFVQHGMWDRVAQSNVASYNASAKWVDAKNLSIEKRDYHSLQWQAYANLQRGVWGKVVEAGNIVEEAARETQSTRLQQIKASMDATYAIETGRFDGITLPSGEADTGRYNSTASLILAAGMGAAAKGDAATADEAAKRMGKIREQAEAKDNAYTARNYSIMEHELQGLAAMARGDGDGALAHLKKATEVEDLQDPPSGPAYPIKPSHELYGEMLLKAGKHDEAIAQFRTGLSRMPNRTASLLGIARAASKSGDKETAAEAYATLQKYLRDADPDVPFLAEVRGYQTSTEDR